MNAEVQHNTASGPNRFSLPHTSCHTCRPSHVKVTSLTVPVMPESVDAAPPLIAEDWGAMSPAQCCVDAFHSSTVALTPQLAIRWPTLESSKSNRHECGFAEVEAQGWQAPSAQRSSQQHCSVEGLLMNIARSHCSGAGAPGC